jgi:hypothetical protein
MAGYETDEAMKAYWDAAAIPMPAMNRLARGSTYFDGTLCLPFPRLPDRRSRSGTGIPHSGKLL